MVVPNYPSNPTIGQQYVVGNKTFQWDGEKWRALSNADASLRSQLAAAGGSCTVYSAKNRSGAVITSTSINTDTLTWTANAKNNSIAFNAQTGVLTLTVNDLSIVPA